MDIRTTKRSSSMVLTGTMLMFTDRSMLLIILSSVIIVSSPSTTPVKPIPPATSNHPIPNQHGSRCAS